MAAVAAESNTLDDILLNAGARAGLPANLADRMGRLAALRLTFGYLRRARLQLEKLQTL
jgi:hypothetical protein